MSRYDKRCWMVTLTVLIVIVLVLDYTGIGWMFHTNLDCVPLN